MRRSLATSLILFASAAAHADGYYNPANSANQGGMTTGYELYSTIGCPGMELLDTSCKAEAPKPQAAKPKAEPAQAEAVTPKAAPVAPVVKVEAAPAKAAPAPAKVAAAPAKVETKAPVTQLTFFQLPNCPLPKSNR